MYIITVWDGISSSEYRIKASSFCQARWIARRKHRYEEHTDWCEVIRMSHIETEDE